MNGAPNANPLLRVKGLSVSLPAGADRAFAIEDVSFDVAAGETLCVVGESGSGKSVAAQAILGLLPPHLIPTTGTIAFQGQDLLRAEPRAMRAIRGRKIAMIFQEPSAALDPVLTVGDQVAEVIRAHEQISASVVQARVVDLFAEVNLPEPERIGRTYPFRLSGGQQQRVMIAMALALKPALLIADEPTTALDVTTQAQILQLISGLQDRYGMAVLFVTHDMGVVADLADRIVVMRKGRIVEEGTPAQVLSRPAHDYTRDLIAAVPRLVVRPLDGIARKQVLRVEHLTKTFAAHGGGLFRRRPPVRAVDDVSFTLAKGETVGIVGESGSGRSTVARCLMRLTDPDAGRVLIGDVDVTALKGAALRHERQRMQIIFQDPYASLNPRQTVETIVGTPLRVQGLSRAAARDRSREVLSLVGLDAQVIDRYPHEFSGGQRQRIGIARALVLEPDVLIADEAVSALDVSVQAQVLALLQDIRERMNLSMIFITHDLCVAAQICDRVLVMRQGKIVEEGTTAAVFQTPQDSYTRSLLDAIPGRDWLRDLPISA